MHQVESKLANLSGDPNWEEICNLCRTAAVEVCGILKLRHGAPWLCYHGTEIQQLDTNIAHAQHRNRAARRQSDPQLMRQCRAALQNARKAKAQQIRTWETTWLSQKAEEANRVMNTPAGTKVFQLVKELKAAVGKGNRDGGRIQAGSPAEVEEWKDHFQAIQQGIGDVDDTIWPDISQRETATFLDDPPSWGEFVRAIRDMRLGKAGGKIVC